MAKRCAQPWRHRLRQQTRRESARAWVESGAPVSVKAFARRYGVDRYTAYADLIAIGLRLPLGDNRRPSLLVSMRVGSGSATNACSLSTTRPAAPRTVGSTTALAPPISHEHRLPPTHASLAANRRSTCTASLPTVSTAPPSAPQVALPEGSAKDDREGHPLQNVKGQFGVHGRGLAVALLMRAGRGRGLGPEQMSTISRSSAGM